MFIGRKEVSPVQEFRQRDMVRLEVDVHDLTLGPIVRTAASVRKVIRPGHFIVHLGFVTHEFNDRVATVSEDCDDPSLPVHSLYDASTSGGPWCAHSGLVAGSAAISCRVGDGVPVATAARWDPLMCSQDNLCDRQGPGALPDGSVKKRAAAASVSAIGPPRRRTIPARSSRRAGPTWWETRSTPRNMLSAQFERRRRPMEDCAAYPAEAT